MLRFNRPAAATVNPRLDLLQTYPFEKLRALVADVKPPPSRQSVSASANPSTPLRPSSRKR
jgi:hypothetical protein